MRCILVLSLFVMFLMPSLAMATPPTPAVAVKLPAPGPGGGISVEKALLMRRSMRTFGPSALSIEEVGQLCWAAQGVTDAKGHRTVPSAMATYPLEVYLVAGTVVGLPSGIYRYAPKDHELVPMTTGDVRDRLVDKVATQPWVATAPAAIIITGTLSRTEKKSGKRAATWVAVEAGEAAQSVFLQAVSLGLGSTYVGGFNPDELRTFLGLPAGEEGLAILPVGRTPSL